MTKPYLLFICVFALINDTSCSLDNHVEKFFHNWYQEKQTKSVQPESRTALQAQMETILTKIQLKAQIKIQAEAELQEQIAILLAEAKIQEIFEKWKQAKQTAALQGEYEDPFKDFDRKR